MAPASKLWTTIATSLGVVGVSAIAFGFFESRRGGRAASSAPSPSSTPPQPQQGGGRVIAFPAPRWPASGEYDRVEPMSNVPSLESWRELFVIFGPDMPIEVEMAWAGEESGGNVCAIGELPPPGASQPQEYGIAMRLCRNVARSFMLGWGWDERGADFWQMVKLWHASPALVKVAPSIERALGRPPHSFAEYQSHADAIGLANQIGHAHTGGSRGYLDDVWLNVSRIGKAITSQGAKV
jgi:hypothetical protein